VKATSPHYPTLKFAILLLRWFAYAIFPLCLLGAMISLVGGDFGYAVFSVLWGLLAAITFAVSAELICLLWTLADSVRALRQDFEDFAEDHRARSRLSRVSESAE